MSVVISALLGSVVTISIASAQTQPYAPGAGAAPRAGYQANDVPPPPTQPNGNDAAPGEMPPPMPFNGGYQPSYYPDHYHYNTGYPGVEVRAVPAALTTRAIARAEYRRLQTGLSLMILEMRKAFERSREYVAAVAEEREAFEQLKRARDEALQSVYEDPSYQASVALRQSLTDQITHRRQDRHSSIDEILSMAQVKMSYASTASAMESAALAADPDVQQARDRLRRASARTIELRQQHQLDVRNNPELEVARRNLQDARISKLAAEVYYDGVREARNIALDYAYHTRRFDRYKYLSYGHYGYYHPYGGQRIGYPVGYPYGY